MKKMIIFAAAGFLVAIGAGVGASMYLAPDDPEPEVAGAESTGQEAHGAGGHGDGRGPGSLDGYPGQDADHDDYGDDPSGDHGGDSKHDAHASDDGHDDHGLANDHEADQGDGAHHEETRSSDGHPPGSSATGSETFTGMEYEEMGRVLTGMQPREVAIFVSHLSDQQLLGILRTMSVREAASILAFLPIPRAKKIKEQLLKAPQ